MQFHHAVAAVGLSVCPSSCFFFFSSRRRHTRCLSDWSSDVCSSDLVTKSQLLASQLAMVLTFLPSFLLSGFMYAIGNMPHAIQVVTYLIPARYFVALLKGIYLKGVGLEILALEAGLLTVFGAAMVLFANLKFKKKLV